MAQVTKYPTVRSYANGNTETYWDDITRIGADDDYAARTTLIASKSGTRSKPGTVVGTNPYFNIHQNSRINWVKLEWEEYIKNPTGGTTGVPTIPDRHGALYYLNGGVASAVKYLKSNVPTGRTYRSLVWYLSEVPNCKPVHINNAAFGAYLASARNTSSNTGYMYLDYLRFTVDYTDPTYSLNASLTANQILGGNVVYQVTLANTNSVHQGYAIPVTISLPAGLTYVSQAGNGTYNPATGKWDAILSGGTATLTLTLQSTTVGNKTVTSTVDFNNVTLSRTTNIVEPTYTLASVLPESVTEQQTFNYQLTIAANSTLVTGKNVTIPIPAGVTYQSQTGDGTFNENTGVWAAEFTDGEATIEITFLATGYGEKTFTATVEGGRPVDTKSIIVISAVVTTPYYTDHLIDPDVLAYMVDGELYTYSWYIIVTDTSLATIYPGEKNFKIGLFQDETEILSDRPLELDTLTRCQVSFTYDSTKEHKLRLYGQYLEISPDTAGVELGGFMLSLGDNVVYQEPGTLFAPPGALIANEEMALANIPAMEQSLPMRLTGFNWAGREEDTSLIIKGLAILFDYQCSADTGVVATINTDGTEFIKSTVLSHGSGEAIIGGASDNWGMTADEILRPTSLALVMEWLNIASTANAVEIRNIRLALYTQYDETMGNLGFTLDGEHSRDYNIFIVPGFDKPEGAKTKFNSLELTGRDGNLITGSRIEDKEIKLKFYVVGSTLEECQERLTEAALWMTSTRNRLKIPTPKTMVFDWDTTREYRVVLDDVVDVDFKDGLFECQAKFNVPDGVAFSPLKVTGAVESNNGLTHVYPVITVITDGQSSNVAIFEHRSNQIFILNHQFTAGTVLIIDCKNRTVKDTDGTDYTTEVALVSVWPMLSGPYDFTRSTGCVIQTVAFQEGK
jgi:hypothetical protein